MFTGRSGTNAFDVRPRGCIQGVNGRRTAIEQGSRNWKCEVLSSPYTYQESSSLTEIIPESKGGTILEIFCG